MYIMKRMDEMDHVTGYAEYTSSIEWLIESAIVMYATRRKHQTENIMTMGTLALPLPLNIPLIA